MKSSLILRVNALNTHRVLSGDYARLHVDEHIFRSALSRRTRCKQQQQQRQARSLHVAKLQKKISDPPTGDVTLSHPPGEQFLVGEVSIEKEAAKGR